MGFGSGLSFSTSVAKVCRWVTIATALLLGIALLVPSLHAQATAPVVSFANTNVGSTASATVTFTFSASTTISSVSVVTQGATGLDFQPGTQLASACKAGTYAASTNCTVVVQFKPLAPGLRQGAAVLLDANQNRLAVGFATGVGIGGLAQLPFTAATTTSFATPNSVLGSAFDGAGNLFFGATNGTVLEAKPDGTMVTFTPSTGSNPYYDGIAVDGAGLVYVADGNHPFIIRFDPAIGIGSQTTYATSSSSNFGALAFDAAGNLYATSNGTGILKVTPSGAVSTLYANTTDAMVSIAIDSSGNLYYLTGNGGSTNLNSILKIASGQTTATLVVQISPSTQVFTDGLAVDPAGNLFYNLYPGGLYELPAGTTTPGPLLVSSPSSSPSVALSGNGSLAFTSSNTVISTYNRLTQNVNTASSTTTATGSKSPAQSVTVENDGNLPLTPTAITGSGAANSTGYTCATGTAVAVNATCTLGVQFAPTAHGSPQTGTLTLAGNTLKAVVSITGYVAGDPVGLSFSTPPPASLQTGQNAGTVAVAIVDDAGNATTSTAAVTLTVSGPSSYSQIYTVNAVNGTATFDLSGAPLTTTGAYTYKATSGTLNSVTANETVYPYKLIFTTPPATPITAGGNAGMVAVAIQDNSGNATTQTSPVTLTVTGPTNYTYGPTTPVNGTATFNLTGVALTKSGMYTYTASATGLTSTPAASETVTPGAATTLAISAATYSTFVGLPDNITVTTLDQYGNTTTGNTDSVSLSSTDSTATLPGSFALASGTATRPVTFNTAGSPTVTATDTTNPTIAAATSVAITVRNVPAYLVTTGSDDASGIAANCPDQANGGGTSNTCSLRDAFAAVTALSNSGTGTYVPTINFATSLYGQTINMTGTSTVNGNVALVGPGAGANAITLSGNNAVTFLSQAASAPITNISGLTFSNFKGAQSTVLIGNGPFTLTNDTFSNNAYTGSNNGGALGINGAITITGCTFTGNTSSGTGGAFATTQTSLTISNSLFSNNTATGSGGAISTYGTGAISIVNTAFLANKAAGGTGGALFVSNPSAPLTITNDTFNNNTATTNGGALYANGLLTISGSSFSANQSGGSAATASGGAIYNFTSATGSITNTNFIGNKATTTGTTAYGGALYVARMNLTNVLFSGNSVSSTSAANGGGAYYTGNYSSTFTGVTFAGNSTGGTAAMQDGGGLYQSLSVLSLYNTTITGNTARIGGGVYKYTGVAASLYNSVISSNTATASYPDEYPPVGSGINSYSNSLIQSPCSTGNCTPLLSALGSYGGGTVGAQGYTTPVQVTIPLPGSPLLAAGSTAYLNGATTDARGIPNNRTLTEAGAIHVDIGAAEANYSLAFVKQPVNAEVGASDISTVQLYESNNLFSPGVTGGTLGLTSAAAQSSATVTMSASGLETINANYNAVAPGNTLTAAIQNAAVGITLASITSSPFDVTSSTGANEGSLRVEGFPASTSAGVAQTVRVSALDTTGAVFAGYVGTVTLTSSDPNAVLPAAYTFTAADAGVHTFTVALKTGGTQSITASDGTFTASQIGIFVVQEYVFVVNSGGTVTTTSSNGTVQSSAIAGGGIGAAVDASGYVWSINAGGNGISRFTDAGTLSSTYNGLGTSSATAIAIGGLGNVFATNGNGTINALTNAGAMLYSTPVAAAAGISAPTALSIDSAGSLWIASSGDNSAVEVIGVAAPVVTPTVNAVKNGNPGTRP